MTPLFESGETFMSAPTQTPDPRVGLVLGGKYRIERRLGEGGMGTVYGGVHVVLNRPVAVKFLHPEYARRPEVLARFTREAKAAGALQSENIVAVTDLDVAHDGAPYIVMEYLVGEDLRSLLKREGPLPVARAADVVVQACRGLALAHAGGVVHRDLKPENLFLCQRGDGSDLVKVVDFGIAKLRSTASDGPKTASGVPIGTPHYMSPEQVRGQADLDGRADVFALGAILYEALSGTLAFDGEELHAILYRILNDHPKPLVELQPSLPAGLVEVVSRAMCVDRDERIGSVQELAKALAPFAAQRVSSAPTTCLAEQPVPAAQAPTNEPRGQAPVAVAKRQAPPRAPREQSGAAMGALSPGPVQTTLGSGAVATPKRRDSKPPRRRGTTIGGGATVVVVLAVALVWPFWWRLGRSVERGTGVSSESPSAPPRMGPLGSAASRASAAPHTGTPDPVTIVPRVAASPSAKAAHAEPDPTAAAAPGSARPALHPNAPRALRAPSRSAATKPGAPAPIPATAESGGGNEPKVIRQQRGKRMMEFDGANPYE